MEVQRHEGQDADARASCRGDLPAGRAVAQRIRRAAGNGAVRDRGIRWRRRRRSRSRRSAPSRCGRRASASAATRKPAWRCRSCRAGCCPSAPPRCSRRASTASPSAGAEATRCAGRRRAERPSGSAPARRARKAPTAFRTISEVADDLHIPQHVLRFWETKFPQLKPLKRGGGRRYYRPEDIALLRRISDLLYTQGYTIKGVQQLLRAQRRGARRRRRQRSGRGGGPFGRRRHCARPGDPGAGRWSRSPGPAQAVARRAGRDARGSAQRPGLRVCHSASGVHSRPATCFTSTARPL